MMKPISEVNWLVWVKTGWLCPSKFRDAKRCLCGSERLSSTWKQSKIKPFNVKFWSASIHSVINSQVISARMAKSALWDGVWCFGTLGFPLLPHLHGWGMFSWGLRMSQHCSPTFIFLMNILFWPCVNLCTSMSSCSSFHFLLHNKLFSQVIHQSRYDPRIDKLFSWSIDGLYSYSTLFPALQVLTSRDKTTSNLNSHDKLR